MKRYYMFIIYFWTLSLSAGIGSEWCYSQASKQLQEGNWEQARDTINQLLIDSPDQPDLLYDAGVASYRLKEFENAEAYLTSVTEKELPDVQLKKQAHFNLGNTKVALNHFEHAIEEYNKVLRIDPRDKRAQHNRDKAKQLLQEQQNKQSSPEKKEQESDKKEKSEQNDQQKQNEQKEAESGSENKKSSNAEQKKEQSANNEKDGKQEDDPYNKSEDQKSSDNKDQLGNSHASPSDKTEHNQSKNNHSHHTQKQEKEQAMQEGKEAVADYREEQRKEFEKKLAPGEKWMARALRQLEKVEEAEQKKLIKATIQKQSVGNNGHNCW